MKHEDKVQDADGGRDVGEVATTDSNADVDLKVEPNEGRFGEPLNHPGLAVGVERDPITAS